MNFPQMVQEFFSTLKKTFLFKRYIELGEKDLGKAFRYFLTLLLVCFLGMTLLLIPKMLDISSSMQANALSIGQLQLDAKLVTKGPIMIPSKSPFLTLDTTGNKSMETERFLITDKAVLFNLWGPNVSVDFATYDFANSREQSLTAAKIMFLMLLPGIILFYYLAYLAKYLLLLVPLSIISYLLSKTFKNTISIGQTLMLGFYAATPMVIIEMLTIPFAMKQILVSKVPIMGVQFSMVAIGIFFVYFVTAIRMNGNRYVRR